MPRSRDFIPIGPDVAQHLLAPCKGCPDHARCRYQVDGTEKYRCMQPPSSKPERRTGPPMPIIDHGTAADFTGGSER